MRAFKILTLALVPALLAAQDTTDSASTASSTPPSAVPECAQPALLAAIQASGCQPTDAQCICSNPTLIQSLTTAVQDACSPANQAAVVAFAQTYCGTSAGSATASPAAGASDGTPTENSAAPADTGDSGDASTTDGADAVAASLTGTTEVAVEPTVTDSSTAGALTVASLPSDVAAPTTTSAVDGGLITDTSSLVTSTSSSMGFHTFTYRAAQARQVLRRLMLVRA